MCVIEPALALPQLGHIAPVPTELAAATIRESVWRCMLSRTRVMISNSRNDRGVAKIVSHHVVQTRLGVSYQVARLFPRLSMRNQIARVERKIKARLATQVLHRLKGRGHE